MLASILSLGLLGIEGFVVTTEVNLAPGMPAFDVVGLPDAAVKESRERVRAALRNSGYAFPNGRLVVNLAPADQKKEGPAFDLPIALGVLACAGEIEAQALGRTAVLGELSLDGAVRSVRGALPMVISALEAGIERVMLPEANLNEVRCVEGLGLLGVSHLKDAVAHFTGKAPISPIAPVQYAELLSRREHSVDFCHVRGQKSAKRALEIVKLDHKMAEPARNLNLCEQKRLEVARAMATEPKLIMLDEVMAGLNPGEVNEVMDIVRDIKQLGITVVIIEHIMQAVMAISDNITVLSFGKKIAEGKPHEIAHNQDVVAVYLGSDYAM